MKAIQRIKCATLLSRAWYLSIKSDRAAALEALEKVESCEPLTPAYRVFKATILTTLGRHDEAATLLRSVIEHGIGRKDAESRYAVTYAQLLGALADENFELAEALFDRAKAIHVSGNVQRILPLTIKPTVQWFRSS